MNVLSPQKVSNHLCPQYLLTTTLLNRISSIIHIYITRVEMREYCHRSYVVCVVVFLLSIVLTIILCIIQQNVNYCLQKLES